MAYHLGEASLAQLEGVHPKLVEIVKEAIKRTPQDFSVVDGVRTAAEQNKMFKKRASKLDGYKKKSMHQKQADGYGHAVDLVPWIGRWAWEWPLIYPIAAVMAQVAAENMVRLKWGGVWDKVMGDLGTDYSEDSMRRAVAAYCVRHPGPDFIDGPHYELA